MSTPESDMERALADAVLIAANGCGLWGFDTLLKRAVNVARTLIACREPVTPTPPTTHSRWSKCACGGNLGVTQSMKFCSECGRPIKWTN